MSIQVNEITKLYGSQKALDAVSMEIRPGQIVGLLGPNGAGKSTLMKILTCFIPPSAGNASVCGFDIYEHSMDIRRKVGYLPENNPLYLDMYVREFLEYVANVYLKETGGTARNQRPATRDGIRNVIALTGLGPEQHKKIGALSKGFRQRVGLAQVLLHDPEVLILDEPTSGLDPNQIQDIRALIREIGAQKTVLLSTHILQEVEAICSRVIIIHKGKIVADDSTSNLQKMTTSQNIIRVEFSAPVTTGDLKGVRGITDLFPDPASGRKKEEASAAWRIASDPAVDIRADLFHFAVEHHLTVLALQKEELKLEEVFQDLTKD